MTDIKTADKLFFENTGMDRHATEKLISDALVGADDGELFLEYRQSEGFSFDDGRLKSASFDTTQGFGLRAFSGEATGFAHPQEPSENAMKQLSLIHLSRRLRKAQLSLATLLSVTQNEASKQSTTK